MSRRVMICQTFSQIPSMRGKKKSPLQACVCARERVRTCLGLFIKCTVSPDLLTASDSAFSQNMLQPSCSMSGNHKYAIF